jgi:hypothetical protein
MYALVPWIAGERLARLPAGLELKSVFQVRPPSTVLLSFSAQLIEPPGIESSDFNVSNTFVKKIIKDRPMNQHRVCWLIGLGH